VYSIQSLIANLASMGWGPAGKMIYNGTIDSHPSTLFMVCATMYACTFALQAYLNGKQGELCQASKSGKENNNK